MDQEGQVLRSGRVPNCYEVKAVARAKIKADKRDSEVPAHLLRMNMISEVYRRSTENRQAQRVLRQRAFYVSAMTALKNRVHAFLAQQREEIREVVARETNIFSEKGQKVLVGLDLAPSGTIIGKRWEDIFRWEENGHAYPIFGFSPLCIQGDSLP